MASGARTASSWPSWRSWAESLTRPPLLDTPDGGLNQAFAWAAGRGAGAVQAEAGPLDEWDVPEFAGLLEAGRSFRRVGPAAIPDPPGFLRDVVAGLFGLQADAGGGRYAVDPWIPEGWKRYALRRVRCHRTLLDIEIRPRAEWAGVRLAVTYGPPVAVALSLRNAPRVSRVTVDDVALEGGRAIFTAAGEHEAMFFYRGVEP